MFISIYSYLCTLHVHILIKLIIYIIYIIILYILTLGQSHLLRWQWRDIYTVYIYILQVPGNKWTLRASPFIIPQGNRSFIVRMICRRVEHVGWCHYYWSFIFFQRCWSRQRSMVKICQDCQDPNRPHEPNHVSVGWKLIERLLFCGDKNPDFLISHFQLFPFQCPINPSQKFITLW